MEVSGRNEGKEGTMNARTVFTIIGTGLVVLVIVGGWWLVTGFLKRQSHGSLRYTFERWRMVDFARFYSLDPNQARSLLEGFLETKAGVAPVSWRGDGLGSGYMI